MKKIVAMMALALVFAVTAFAEGHIAVGGRTCPATATSCIADEPPTTDPNANTTQTTTSNQLTNSDESTDEDDDENDFLSFLFALFN